MLIIAHRGNLEGSNLQTENTYDQILKCLSLGLSVEIDIWWKDEKFWIGHDAPQKEFDKELKLLYYYVKSGFIFVHAKNIEAMNEMILRFDSRNYYNKFDYFLHDKDQAVLTKTGYIWTYPGKELFENSIAVMPELCFEKYQNKVQELFLTNKISGICTNYPLKWIELEKSKKHA